MVPVVRDTDLKSLTQINAEVKELAGKARNKNLSMEEMTGNTFTISNLGNFGIEEFTAIINPPDACILAVGSIMQKAIERYARESDDDASVREIESRLRLRESRVRKQV